MQCVNCDRLPFVRHVAGSTFDEVLTIYQADGAPFEFSDSTTGEFWLSDLTGSRLENMGVIFLPTPAVGQIRLTLPATATQELRGRYLWSCEIDSAGGKTVKLASNGFYLEI